LSFQVHSLDVQLGHEDLASLSPLFSHQVLVIAVELNYLIMTAGGRGCHRAQGFKL
jgi:hypothetical protein